MISPDLTGKTEFVSGSTPGFGLAPATRLAEAGARVAINARGAEKVESAVLALAEHGPAEENLFAVPGDVGSGCVDLILP